MAAAEYRLWATLLQGKVAGGCRAWGLGFFGVEAWLRV